MHDNLIKNYGMDDSNIRVLDSPKKEVIEKAIKEMGDSGGDNSQALIYYDGHGEKNILASPTGITNDPENMDKSTLQKDVNKYLSPYYDNTSLIIDSCKSGSFVK